MNIYINTDNSLCFASIEADTNLGHLETKEVDTNNDVLTNYGEYSYINNEFIKTSEIVRTFTQDELSQAITNKATEIIESKYSALKQRKMLSIAIALQDKQLDGLTLSDEELALKQANKDANTWIASIRDIENEAIANNTAIENIDWEI